MEIRTLCESIHCQTTWHHYSRDISCNPHTKATHQATRTAKRTNLSDSIIPTTSRCSILRRFHLILFPLLRRVPCSTITAILRTQTPQTRIPITGAPWSRRHIRCRWFRSTTIIGLLALSHWVRRRLRLLVKWDGRGCLTWWRRYVCGLRGLRVWILLLCSRSCFGFDRWRLLGGEVGVRWRRGLC